MHCCCSTVIVTCQGTSNILKPWPTDCSKYYTCLHSNPVVYSCNQGTLFDTKIGSCNTAALAMCGTIPPPPAPTIPASTSANPPLTGLTEQGYFGCCFDCVLTLAHGLPVVLFWLFFPSGRYCVHFPRVVGSLLLMYKHSHLL